MAKKKSQKAFQDMEPEEIKEIREAAEDYVEARDERMDLTKTESEKSDILLKLMRKYRKDRIQMEGLRVEVVEGDAKVKVKMRKDEEADDGE